jgi:Uma2 family endonuclease
MPTTLLKGPFTVADYRRLAEVGILGEDDRVELLDGQVVVMTPVGPRHAGCVNRLADLLWRIAGGGVTVSIQNPVVLGERREPQPDVAVLKRRTDGYATTHPTAGDILLLIEVAESSLDVDRDRKIPLYAAAGVPEVWLVDLEGGRILLNRSPSPDGYAEVLTASPGETVAPVELPDAVMEVGEILG